MSASRYPRSRMASSSIRRWSAGWSLTLSANGQCQILSRRILRAFKFNNLESVNPWHRPCFTSPATRLADFPEDKLQTRGRRPKHVDQDPYPAEGLHAHRAADRRGD